MKLKRITKREKQLIYAIFFLFLFIVGSIMNLTVKLANNGMMPVYTADKKFDYIDDEHFTFQNKSKINLFYFTDIIHIPLVDGYISLGDCFVWMGLFFFNIFSGKWIYLLIKRKKK